MPIKSGSYPLKWKVWWVLHVAKALHPWLQVTLFQRVLKTFQSHILLKLKVHLAGHFSQQMVTIQNEGHFLTQIWGQKHLGHSNWPIQTLSSPVTLFTKPFMKHFSQVTQTTFLGMNFHTHRHAKFIGKHQHYWVYWTLSLRLYVNRLILIKEQEIFSYTQMNKINVWDLLNCSEPLDSW